MRTLARLIAGAAISMMPHFALSADIAQIQVLGFSGGGEVFAFEEYGVQDGSGFPYSNIYFIDTQTDTYLDGTPIKVLLEGEDVPLSQARRQAADEAETLLGQHRIADNPGILGAFNPLSEKNVAADEISYVGHQHIPSSGGEFTLKLETVPFPIPERCEDLTETYAGFKLRYSEIAGDTANEVAYADERVPASRGCVTGYRLGGVALPGNGGGPHMALIEIHTFGFEGQDGRWIAVPVTPGQ